MEYFNQTVLDSLIDQIAVLDRNGYIVAINKAWIDFSARNNGDLSKSGVGTNYLDVCQEEVKQGILHVLENSKEYFTFEYPCHSEAEIRWFLLRATSFADHNVGSLGAVVSHVNITERKLAELELKKSEQRYRLIAENSTDFISILTLQHIFTYVSPICYSLLGYEPDEMLGRSFYDFLHPEDIDRIAALFEFVQTKDHIQTMTYRIRRKDKGDIWFETKSQNLLYADGNCEEIICISRDVTEYRRKLKKLETEKDLLQKTIYIDELTGIHNRRFFNKRLKDEFKKNIEGNGILSLLVIDIDYFKQYNDTYGHQQGDECLKAVANTLKKYVREQDAVCRIGGEEFCIVLPNTSLKTAIPLAERLCKKVEDLQIPHHKSAASRYVTISVGLAAFDGSTLSLMEPNELFQLADQALYEAKEEGRNQVKIMFRKSGIGG